MQITYGFHGADLIKGRYTDDLDLWRSSRRYADLLEAEIKRRYPEAEVIILFDVEASGPLPQELRPNVNGDYNHGLLSVIQDIAEDIEAAYDWPVIRHVTKTREKQIRDTWHEYMGDVTPEACAGWDLAKIRETVERRLGDDPDLSRNDRDGIADDLAVILAELTE